MKNDRNIVVVLLASTMILAGLLFIQLGHNRSDSTAHTQPTPQTAGLSQLFESSAEGAMIVSQGDFMILTAAYRRDADVVYMLDTRNELMITYLVDRNRQTVERLGRLELGPLFAQAVRAGAAAGGGDGGRIGR